MLINRATACPRLTLWAPVGCCAVVAQGSCVACAFNPLQMQQPRALPALAGIQAVCSSVGQSCAQSPHCGHCRQGESARQVLTPGLHHCKVLSPQACGGRRGICQREGSKGMPRGLGRPRQGTQWKAETAAQSPAQQRRSARLRAHGATCPLPACPAARVAQPCHPRPVTRSRGRDAGRAVGVKVRGRARGGCACSRDRGRRTCSRAYGRCGLCTQRCVCVGRGGGA